jgi:3-oxoacyl-[acyl-carrier-protein] synthase II
MKLGRHCVKVNQGYHITRFDASGFDTKIAGEVKNFHPKDFLSKKEAKRTQLFIAYAVAASRMALENSGLTIDKTNETESVF